MAVPLAMQTITQVLFLKTITIFQHAAGVPFYRFPISSAQSIIRMSTQGSRFSNAHYF